MNHPDTSSQRLAGTVSSAHVWPSLSAQQQLLMQQAHAALAPGLAKDGHARDAVMRVCAAVVAHCSRWGLQGLPVRMSLDTDAGQVVLDFGDRGSSSLHLTHALTRHTAEHLAEAAGRRSHSTSVLPVVREPVASYRLCL